MRLMDGCSESQDFFYLIAGILCQVRRWFSYDQVLTRQVSFHFLLQVTICMLQSCLRFCFRNSSSKVFLQRVC